MLQQTTESKLTSQEVFWSAKFKSMMREHEEEMGRVRAEVDLMRSSAEGARNELEKEMLARQQVRTDVNQIWSHLFMTMPHFSWLLWTIASAIYGV